MKKGKSLLLSLIFLTSCGSAPSGVDALIIKPGGDALDYNVLVYCDKRTEDVTIPRIYNNLPIRSISGDVFKNCENLVNVTFEGTFEEWFDVLMYNEYSNPMSYAENFYLLDENKEVYELNEVVVPDSITKVDVFQFYNFKKIEKIELNGVRNVGKKAFYNCDSVKSVKLSSKLTRVGVDAFDDCDSVIFLCEAESKPSGWQETWNSSNRPVYWGVNENTFAEVDGLQFVVSNDTAVLVRYVGDAENVTIPSTVTIGENTYDVTSIENYAFQNCEEVKSVTIPSTVTTVASNAFEGCSATRK